MVRAVHLLRSRRRTVMCEELCSIIWYKFILYLFVLKIIFSQLNVLSNFLKITQTFWTLLGVRVWVFTISPHPNIKKLMRSDFKTVKFNTVPILFEYMFCLGSPHWTVQCQRKKKCFLIPIRKHWKIIRTSQTKRVVHKPWNDMFARFYVARPRNPRRQQRHKSKQSWWKNMTLIVLHDGNNLR